MVATCRSVPQVDNRLSQLLLDGRLGPTDTASFDVREGDLVVT